MQRQFYCAERGFGQLGNTFFIRTFRSLAIDGHFHISKTLFHRVHADFMGNVPFHSVQLRQDRRRRAVGINIIIESVHPGHHAAAAVAADIILFQLVDTVEQCARLFYTIGILFYCPQLGLYGFRCLGTGDAQRGYHQQSRQHHRTYFTEFHRLAPPFMIYSRFLFYHILACYR